MKDKWQWDGGALVCRDARLIIRLIDFGRVPRVWYQASETQQWELIIPLEGPYVVTCPHCGYTLTCHDGQMVGLKREVDNA